MGRTGSGVPRPGYSAPALSPTPLAVRCPLGPPWSAHRRPHLCSTHSTSSMMLCLSSDRTAPLRGRRRATTARLPSGRKTGTQRRAQRGERHGQRVTHRRAAARGFGASGKREPDDPGACSEMVDRDERRQSLELRHVSGRVGDSLKLSTCYLWVIHIVATRSAGAALVSL